MRSMLLTTYLESLLRDSFGADLSASTLQLRAQSTLVLDVEPDDSLVQLLQCEPVILWTLDLAQVHSSDGSS